MCFSGRDRDIEGKETLLAGERCQEERQGSRRAAHCSAFALLRLVPSAMRRGSRRRICLSALVRKRDRTMRPGWRGRRSPDDPGFPAATLRAACSNSGIDAPPPPMGRSTGGPASRLRQDSVHARARGLWTAGASSGKGRWRRVVCVCSDSLRAREQTPGRPHWHRILLACGTLLTTTTGGRCLVAGPQHVDHRPLDVVSCCRRMRQTPRGARTSCPLCSRNANARTSFLPAS